MEFLVFVEFLYKVYLVSVQTLQIFFSRNYDISRKIGKRRHQPLSLRCVYYFRSIFDCWKKCIHDGNWVLSNIGHKKIVLTENRLICIDWALLRLSIFCELRFLHLLGLDEWLDRLMTLMFGWWIWVMLMKIFILFVFDLFLRMLCIGEIDSI